MTRAPLIIPCLGIEGAGQVIRGAELVIGDWPATGVESEVAPLHVHHVDDEAWHVISGALRFRFEDRECVADAGSTVLVPAGVPHIFGNAGPEPSRFLIIVPRRLDELISRLHETNRYVGQVACGRCVRRVRSALTLTVRTVDCAVHGSSSGGSHWSVVNP